MTTLRDINKDRRCKLTEEHIDFIHQYYHLGLTMGELAEIVGVSRQRIGQVLDIKGTRADIIARQVARNKTRYHDDIAYRRAFLEGKKRSYQYKTTVMC
jgi:predicted DNA-binding protein YlxM (UPF0122 family)